MPHPMDARLIFRDFRVDRWSDEVQYAVRIIGFNVRAIRVCPGQIRMLASRPNSSRAKMSERAK